MAPLERKHCTKCKKYKERKDFTVDNGRKDGKYPYCKKCLKAYRDRPDVKARRNEYDRQYKLLYAEV